MRALVKLEWASLGSGGGAWRLGAAALTTLSAAGWIAYLLTGCYLRVNLLFSLALVLAFIVVSDRLASSVGQGFVWLASGVIVAAALWLPPERFGDAHEYFLMTESWANHGSPDLRADDLARVRVFLPDLPHPSSPAAPIGYLLAPDGRHYSYHFWGYSLASAPLTLILRALGHDELKALQAANAGWLMLAVLHITLLSGLDGRQRVLLSLLSIFSPALLFVRWPHPEVFCFVLVTLALVYAGRGQPRLAIASAAIAATQNPTLLVMVGWMWLRALHPRPTLTRVLATSAAATPAVIPYVFYFLAFGSPSLLISTGAAGPQYISAFRVWELLFDLNIGVFPYAPISLVVFLVIVVRDLAARLRVTPAVQGAVVMGMMLAGSAMTANWNHGTSGPSRYVVWMLPLIFDGLVRQSALTATDSPLRRRYAALLAVAVLAQATITLDAGGLSPRADSYLYHSRWATFVLDHFPAAYRPSPEIFAERTVHREPVTEPYAIYFDGGRCRKALIAKGDEERLEAICGASDPGRRHPVRGPDNRELMYVDF